MPPLIYAKGKKKIVTKHSLKDKRKTKRSRNKTAPANADNKWVSYRKKINRLLLGIKRDEYYCNVLSMQKHGNDIIQLGELQRSHENIRKSKYQILELLDALAAENAADERYPYLEASDEDNMVDVMSVNCSRCGKADEDGNDILFCDHKGCNRAYHETCLDPPLVKGSINLDDPDEDWFCWQCECMDDCLDMVGDILECGPLMSVTEVFPTLRAEAGGPEGERYMYQSDSDEEYDEDFIPSPGLGEEYDYGREDSESDDNSSDPNERCLSPSYTMEEGEEGGEYLSDSEVGYVCMNEWMDGCYGCGI